MSSFAKGAAWTTSGDAARMAIQAAVFFAVAALLGVEGLGLFAGSVAVANIAFQFSGWGSDQLMIRAVANDPLAFRRWFGTALVVSGVVSVALAGLVMLLGGAILGSGFQPWLLFWIVVGDIVAARGIVLAWNCFLACDDLARSAAIKVAWSANRLAAVAVFAIAFESRSPVLWAGILAIFNLIFMVGALAVAISRLGRPNLHEVRAHMQWGEGFYFAVGHSARTVNLDADKALVLRLTNNRIAGEYTASYRMVTFASVALTALIQSRLTAIFRDGAQGIVAAAQGTRQLARLIVFFGGLAAIAAFSLSPLIPRLVGQDFAGTVTIVRWLAFLPLVDASVLLMSTILMAAGRIRFVSAAQMGFAIFNVLLSIVLIREFAWRGAVIATYVAEIALLGVLWLGARRFIRDEALRPSAVS